jgi:hypothetical protein
MIRSFKDKMKDKQEAYQAEQERLAIIEEQKRKEREWELFDLEQKAIAEKNQQILAEEESRQHTEYLQWKQEQQILQEQLEQLPAKPIDTGIGMGHEATWKLTWMSFSTHPKIIDLPMSEKIRLFKIAQSRDIDRMNQPAVLGGGGSAVAVTNTTLTFAGNNDYVRTTFNPDNYDGTETGLNHGFTVSFWVKPATIGGFLKALGRRSEDGGRFEFGLKSADAVHVGVGAAAKYENTHNDGVAGGHGMTVGNWYHWVVTYGGDNHDDIGGDTNVRIWINGNAITKTGATGGGMGIANWQPSWTNTVNESSNLYFGARSEYHEDNGNAYNQGWACSLSEVAIYKTETDDDGTFANAVYNGGTSYDHRNNSNLVGYWKLNEGAGTHAEDLSGYGNHGTLTTAGTEIPTWSAGGRNF